jgi:hypothetical protein
MPECSQNSHRLASDDNVGASGLTTLSGTVRLLGVKTIVLEPTQVSRRSWRQGAVIGLVLLAAACGAMVTPMPATATPRPTQEVVSTRLMAELMGQLELVDGCLRVRSSYGPESLLLVWPVDITATVSGETVVMADSLLGTQTTWHLGDSVVAAGGYPDSPIAGVPLRIIGPATCPGPYFVVSEVYQSSSPTPTTTSTEAPASTPTPAGS